MVGAVLIMLGASFEMGDASLKTGHLLVNLGFWICRFPDLLFSRFVFCLQNRFGKSGGEISMKSDKGVLGRPWTK